jgi:tetratricopeptide (TPR) repeat protein
MSHSSTTTSTPPLIFKLKVTLANSSAYQVTLSLPDSVNILTAPFTLPSPSDIALAHQLMISARVDDSQNKTLKELGQRFKECLLPAELGLAFDKAWEDTNPQIPIQLHLDLPDFATQRVPWEYLTKADTFLATRPRFTLSRAAQLGDTPPYPVNLALPLRLLIVVSSPLDLVEEKQLDADREVQLIRRGVKEAVAKGEIVLEVEDIASLEKLGETLDSFKPHLLHLTGHGFLDLNDKGESHKVGLLLEDNKGNSLKVAASDLAAKLQDRPYLRAVVLSACVTALPELRDATGQAISNTASALIAAGIPAVIAMQESIRDDSAIRFARYFYPALVTSQSIGAALANARKNMSEPGWTNNNKVSTDWAMPVLLTAKPELNPFMFSDSQEDAQLAPTWGSRARFKGTAVAVLREENYFVGRQRELRQLREVLTGSDQRLAIISGLGGMGKSTLTQRSLERFSHQHQLIQLISCKNWQGLVSAVSSLARSLAEEGYERLQKQLETPQEYSPADYGTLVGQALNEARCILLLDNFEDLLDWHKQVNSTTSNVSIQSASTAKGETEISPTQAQSIKPSDPAIATWLESLLLNLREGRVLITSRYDFSISERYEQTAICRVTLNRLGRGEALRLMSEYPKLAELEWTNKIRQYAKGLDQPLLIALAHTHLVQGGQLEDLQDKVHQKYSLDMTFEQLYQALPAPAQMLWRRCAVYQEALPEEFWSKQMNRARQWLQPLVEYHIVDRTEQASTFLNSSDQFKQTVYSQHQSVRYFGLQQLAQEAADAEGDGRLEAAHLRAAQHYEYYATNLSNELGDYISAKSHYVEAGALKEAVRLVQKLNLALNRLGFWRVALLLNGDLAERLDNLAASKGEIDTEETRLRLAEQAEMLMMTAIHLDQLGDPLEAIAKHEQALKLFEEVQDQEGIGRVYGNLGNTYFNLGDYSKAIDFQQKRLQIAQEIGDKHGEGGAYGGLGLAYSSLGDYPKAIAYQQKSLQIALEIGDKQGARGCLW